MMSNSIVKYEPHRLTLDEIERHAGFVAASGDFPTIKNPSQAVIQIAAGQELGIGWVAAVSGGIHILHEKIVISGNALASLIRGPRSLYQYKILEHNETICNIGFYYRDTGELIGESKFDLEDAKKGELLTGGIGTWRKFPRNMLFNRSISNGVKWYCPEITNGQTVYLEGEIENSIPETVNEEPFIIESKKDTFSEEDKQVIINLASDSGQNMSYPAMVKTVNIMIDAEQLDRETPVTLAEVIKLVND